MPYMHYTQDKIQNHNKPHQPKLVKTALIQLTQWEFNWNAFVHRIMTHDHMLECIRMQDGWLYKVETCQFSYLIHKFYIPE